MKPGSVRKGRKRRRIVDWRVAYGWLDPVLAIYQLQPIRLYFEQEFITNRLELSFNLMYICATRSIMAQPTGATL